MLNWFARRMKEVQEKDKTGQGGFTLIELLVVVIIIGILAAIAIPTFLSQRTKAQDADATSLARNYATAAKTWLASQPAGTNYSSATFTQANVKAQDTALTDKAAGASANVTVAANGNDNFTIEVPSASGKKAVFSSATGSVTVT